MTKQTSQFGCGYLQTAQEVTESLILNSNHSRTSFAALSTQIHSIVFATFVQSAWCTSRQTYAKRTVFRKSYKQNSNIQGRHQADATDAAALGPAPQGPRAMVVGQVVHFCLMLLTLENC